MRIPETLVCAMEFITMHTPSEQNAALDELRRLVLRANPDLKDKPVFWKRKASVLKVWGSVGSERVWGEGGWGKGPGGEGHAPCPGSGRGGCCCSRCGLCGWHVAGQNDGVPQGVCLQPQP